LKACIRSSGEQLKGAVLGAQLGSDVGKATADTDRALASSSDGTMVINVNVKIEIENSADFQT
jgi:hypothetical protein